MIRVIFLLVLISANLSASELAKAILNPYSNAPLSALIPADVNSIRNVRVKIFAPEGQKDFEYALSHSSIVENGGISIFGLYENQTNIVQISALSCDESGCRQIKERQKITTPKSPFQLSKSIKIASDEFEDALIMFFKKDGTLFALDSRGNLRWWLKSAASAYFQAANSDILLAEGDRIKRLNLIGKEVFSIELAPWLNGISSISQSEGGVVLFNAKNCQQECEQSALFGIENFRYFKLEPKSFIRPSEKLSDLSLITPDSDGYIIALADSSMIAKIDEHGKLIWMLSAARGWQKQLLRRNLKIQDADFMRLNCDQDSCFNSYGDEVFYYPNNPISLSVLGHKNSNLILAVYDQGKECWPNQSCKKPRSRARVFEIDERRLSLREIWSSVNDIYSQEGGSINGDLKQLRIFMPSQDSGQFFVYSYDISTPFVGSVHSGSIDLALDFSKIKQNKIQNRLLLSMQVFAPDLLQADFMKYGLRR